MADSLTDKIEKVKDEHAEQAHGELMTYHDERAKAEAFFQLGRMKQNDVIAHAVFSNLTSQTIRAAESFQKEKRFKALGFQTMDQFLDQSEFSPMTKRQYYDRLALVRSQGDDIYDLLTAVGISVRSQKLLGKGDLVIKDDQLFIGETVVEVGNVGVIKQVLNELFDERRQIESEKAKLKDENAELKQALDIGQDEFAQLQRNLDAMKDGNPYDQALAQAVHALGELSFRIGQMPDAKKAERGPDGIDLIWTMVQKVKQSYGIGYNFVDQSAAPATAAAADPDDFDAKLQAAINEPDDLDQEDDD